MKTILKILNISKDELALVGIMTSLFFVLIFGNLLAVNAGNSLFSFHFGGTKNLPQMYLLLALISCFLALFMTFFADRFPRIFLMRVLCFLMLFFSLIVHQAYRFHATWTSIYFPILYLGIQLSWLMSNMQYWLIANDICDTREAKRLFSLFSSGGILAGCLAGIFAQWFVKNTDTVNLLHIWSGMLIIAIFLLNHIEKIFKQRLKVKKSSVEGEEESYFFQLKSGLSYLVSDPMLKGIAITFCLLQLLIFNTDYYFIEIINDLSQSSTDLAAKFGWVRSFSSFLSLLIQLFLTSRIVAFFGVGNTFLIFPLTLVFHFSYLAISFDETAAIFARTNRIVLVTSLFTATQNMLFNPLAAEIRGRVRTIISIFFEPLGIGLSGIFFLGITSHFKGPQICMISAVIALLTVFLSLFIKKYYVKSLVKNLDSGSHEIRFEAIEFLGREKEMIQPLVKALKSQEPQIRLNAAIALGHSRNPKALPILIDAINDREEEVRDAVCEAIGKQGGQPILKPLLEQLAVENVKKVKATIIKSISKLESEDVKNILIENLKDSDTRIIANSIEALHNFKDNREVLEIVKPFITHKNHRIRANTAVLLINSKIREYQAKGTDTLTKMLYNRNKMMRCSALIAFGEVNREEYLSFLVNALGDDEPEVRYNAVKAIGKIPSTRTIPDLLDMFGDRDERVRKETINTLALFGEQVNPLLMEIIESESSLSKKTLAIQALGQFGKKESINTLLKMVGSEVNEIAQAAVNALKGIKDPVIIEPLIEHLQSEDGRVKATIITVLGSFKEKRLKNIFLQYLNDESDRIRSNALDALEGLQDPKISETVLPLLEDSSPRVRATAARVLDRLGYPQGRGQLKIMLAHPDKWIKTSAIYALGELGNADFTMLIVNYISDPDPDIRRNARLALEKIGAQMILDGEESQVDAGTLKTLSQYSLEPLIAATKNEDPKVRLHALKLLKDLPEIGDLSPLKQLLSHEKDPKTIKASLQIFAKYPQEKYLEDILNCLNMQNNEINLEALRALRGYDTEKIKDPIIHFSTQLSEKLKKIQKRLLKIISTGETLLIEKIGQSLKKEQESLVKIGLEILATLHDSKTIFFIEKKLSDPDPRVRANAIEALESIGEKSIVKILLPILETKIELARQDESIGVFSIMTELLEEKESGLKEKTMEVLEEFGIHRLLLPFFTLNKNEKSLIQKRSLFFQRLRKILDFEMNLQKLNEDEQQLLNLVLETMGKKKEDTIKRFKEIIQKAKRGVTKVMLLRVISIITQEKAIPLLEEYLQSSHPDLKKEAFQQLLETDSEIARKLVLQYYKSDPELESLFQTRQDL
ncbi:Npt1/Npt2 family nucleotide transporter [Candidatus Riflebacteria bacterium]